MTSDLHMIKFQHITLTEHMALLKPNTESAACMERLPMDMIEKIKQNYTDENGEWIETERTKTIYLRNGKEISEREEIDAILHHTYDEKKEIKFMVNEGDMSNYWTATAANAIKPLLDMIVMSTDNLTEKDVVWSGD